MDTRFQKQMSRPSELRSFSGLEDGNEPRNLSVHNEYRYYDLLSLWPPEEMDPRTSGEQHVACSTPVVTASRQQSSDATCDLDEQEESGRESVVTVLHSHLEYVEQGHISLLEAFRAVKRFDGERWIYKPGDVVEWRGGDLRWRLGIIVEARAESYSIFSPAGVQIAFGENDPDVPTPRPSNKVLRVIFGPTPFRWQQYTLLEAEKIMVHRRCSPDDFQNTEWAPWAEQRWDEWLQRSSSSAFRFHFHTQRPGAQRALKMLILEPFRLIDEINTKWNLRSEGLTPYMYLACLGSGSLNVVICLVIQIGSALCLWRYHILIDHSEEDRKEWARHEGFVPCNPSADRGPRLGNVMICIIALYYLCKVVPDTFSAAMTVTAWRNARFSAIGTRNNRLSGQDRVSSLRREIRASDKDTLKMMIGFRLHEFMNTGFDACLYFLNLYILFGTRSVLEILLNCVAVEWIRSIDEGFCKAPWWDRDGRYISAAAVEMVFRNFLDIQSLERRRCDLILQSRSSREPSSAYCPVGLGPSASCTTSSEFVDSRLSAELFRFYGHDLKQRTPVTWWTNFAPRAGCTWIFGRYKLNAFRRWERFLDGTIQWQNEISDFDHTMHDVRLSRHARLQLVYGDVPGFPQASKRLTPGTRYNVASFLHKYPALTNTIITIFGIKLGRAFRRKSVTYGGASHYRVRHLANILDALAEFISIWIVLIFPVVIFIAIFYFPFCY